MGVIITGTNDNIKAADGSLSIEGFSIKTSGIGTFDGGVQVGSAVTIHSNGNLGLTGILTATNFKSGDSNVHNKGYNVGTAVTIDGNTGNAALSGIMTASSYVGDGSALTGIAGTEITNSDFAVGVSTFFADYSTGRIGIGTITPEEELHIHGATGTSYIKLTDEASGSGGTNGAIFGLDNPHLYAWNYETGDFVAATSATERFRIRADGRISIASSLAVTGIVTASTIVTDYQTGNRNVLINGAMRVSQRGTSEASLSNTNTFADAPDRWKLDIHSSAGTWTASQSTESPTGFSNSYKLDNTTAGSSNAAKYLVLDTRLEGFDVQRFGKGVATARPGVLSFYVKTNKTGTYCVEFRDYDNATMVGGTYVVSDTNWNRYTVSMPAGTSGAFGNDNGFSFGVRFWLAAGTNFTSGSAASTWTSVSNSILAVGQTVDLSDSTSNEWHITGIQLELGETATPYEHLLYGDEERRCMRYYQRFGSPKTFINSSSSGWQDSTIFCYAMPFDGDDLSSTQTLAVTMRDSPTSSMTDANIQLNHAGDQITSGNTLQLSNTCDPNHANLRIDTAGNDTDMMYTVTYNSGSAYTDLSAEF